MNILYLLSQVLLSFSSLTLSPIGGSIALFIIAIAFVAWSYYLINSKQLGHIVIIISSVILFAGILRILAPLLF